MTKKTKHTRFEEKLKKIISVYVDDWNKQTYLLDSILTAIADELPEDITPYKEILQRQCSYSKRDSDLFADGFNDCLSEVHRRLGIK